MLRRNLPFCIPFFIAAPCLLAQNASPGSSQACTYQELIESVRPTDPEYAETVQLTRELENRGYVVRCVLRSKFENTFQGQLGAALYRTSRGDFEALFLTKPSTFDSVHLVELHEKNGFYQYSFQGNPSSKVTMDSAKRNFFAKHANRLFITQDSMQLAADLGEVLNSTLSAWESEAALRAFVQNQPHLRVMTALAPHMDKTKFVRWKVKGSDLPLRWDDALRRGDNP